MKINLSTYGFSLGDRVTGMRTGIGKPSTIIGFVPSTYYNSGALGTRRWDELYPDWKEKMVVFTAFDVPTVTCSPEEVLEGLPEGDFKTICRNNSVMLEAYCSSVLKPTGSVAYPIDDLQFYSELS